jgi:hypothetical protein
VVGTPNDNIDFADAWSGDEGPAPLVDDSKVVEVPVSLTGIANLDVTYARNSDEVQPAPFTDNLDVVDAWSDEEVPAPVALSQVPPLEPSRLDIDLDPLAFAAQWLDEEADPEHSGDELVDPSYSVAPASTPVAGVSGQFSRPVLPDSMELAENNRQPAMTGGDWSYGPDHFAFLQDKMFEYEDGNE